MGFILFAMRCRGFPFKKAIKDDPVYNKLVSGHDQAFWKYHEDKQTEHPYYSEEFRSLVGSMLTYDMAKRPNLEEIKTHDWMNGRVASQEEVQHNMRQFKQNIDGQVLPQNVSSDDTTAPVEERKVDMKYWEGITRGGTGEEEEEEEEEPPTQRNPPAAYPEDYYRVTTFKSKRQAEDIFTDLHIFRPKGMDVKEKVNDKEYKVKLSIVDKEKREVTIGVRLFSKGEVVIVEFMKKEGDLMLFYDAYRAYRENLEMVEKANGY